MSVNQRAIEYVILGDSSGAIKAFKRTEEAANLAENNFQKVGKSMEGIGTRMSSLGYSLTKVGIPIALIGGYAIKSAVQFQTSMTLLRTQAGASAKEVKYLEQNVLKLGHTGFDSTELSAALYPIRSDGFEGAKALEVLKVAAAGAQVSGASLTLTANALGGTLRTRLKDVTNAAGAMRILNSTVGLGKFKLEELDEALTSGFLTAAKRAGIGLAETGDALDALARKSIPPGVEATRLQKTLIQFGTVTGIAKRSLREIGIGQYTLAQEMEKHGLIAALQLLQHHLSGLQKPQQNYILGEAFGRSKGSSNVGALLEALPEMEKIQKDREKYGSIFQALGVKESTSAFKVAEAIANLKNALISMGTVLLPVVIPALSWLAKTTQGVVEWFTKLPKPVQDFVLILGGLIVVGGPILIFLGSLTKALGILLETIGRLGPTAAAGATEMEGEAAAFSTAGGVLGAAFALGLGAALVVGVPKAIHGLTELLSPGYLKKHSLGEVESLLATGSTHRIPNLGGGGKYATAGGVSAYDYNVTHPKQGEQEHTYPTTSVTVGGRTYYLHPGEAGPNGEKIELHIHLDGKPLAHSVVKHIRDSPVLSKKTAEAVVKTAQNKTAREGH
jgi:TP901 family phage tail tape measure protein